MAIAHDASRVRARDLIGLERHEVPAVHDLLDYLRYDDHGRLRVHGHDAHDLLTRAGAPLIWYLGDRVRANYQAVDGAYRARFPRHRTFAAVKACYVKECLTVLSEAGAGAEVMSALELQIALQTGFAPADIVSNGVGRSPRYADATVAAGVGLTVLDCLEDLATLAAACRRHGARARVGLRVTPPVDHEGIYITPSSKLGVDWEGGEFLRLARAALDTPEVDVVALHAHQVTHCSQPAKYRAVLAGVADVARAVERELGLRFEVVDIGGGLETRFLLHRSGLGPEDFAAVAKEELDRIGYPFVLHIEPGRFLTADAAVGLTRVTAEKHNGDHRYLITEIGSNVLIDMAEVTYHPLPTVLPAPDAPWAGFDVGDSTCAPALVCRSATLPDTPDNRTLLLLNCGAYSTVFTQLWAFRLPRYLFSDGDEPVRTLFDDEAQSAMYRALYGYEIRP
ncbi:diaminopimelate decarboxylase family protein [Streptomyces sp. NPDC086023]|uniref:diaminopimelate decarboxylase family protein n=1 Tax=Streptomyces sp. NPDC086023 TaxID=3365746 RepID=UPI0037D201F1